MPPSLTDTIIIVPFVLQFFQKIRFAYDDVPTDVRTQPAVPTLMPSGMLLRQRHNPRRRGGGGGRAGVPPVPAATLCRRRPVVGPASAPPGPAGGEGAPKSRGCVPCGPGPACGHWSAAGRIRGTWRR